MLHEKINKIFHYARADLLFIKKYLDIDVININDTKLASKLARTFSDKHGLKDLIKEFIGIDVSKQLQTSDFGGELTEKQLQYCAGDVIYLHKIYDGLEKTIITADSPLQACFRAIKHIFKDVPVNGFYKVSEQGFEDHDDDVIFSSESSAQAAIGIMHKRYANMVTIDIHFLV